MSRSQQAPHRYWSEAEVKTLSDFYAYSGRTKAFGLQSLADLLGRNKANVARKARELGLTNTKRVNYPDGVPSKRKTESDAQLRQMTGERIRKWIQNNGHPKGMLGKKHTNEAKLKMSETSKQVYAELTQEQKDDLAYAQIKGRYAKRGTLTTDRPHGAWKAGWREIGGARKYYRSRWEANYARYLEWLKSLGEIAEWKHEPKTFWFDGIRRGTVSYLPDFWVKEIGGKEAYHEVKGWMDDKSKLKIKRMQKYHPDVVLVVIASKEYAEIRRKVSALIPGWE